MDESGMDESSNGETTPGGSVLSQLLTGRRILITALALIVVLLVVGGVLLGVRLSADRRASDDRAGAVLVARQKVLDLLDLTDKDAKPSLARVLQGTTGQFKDQFSAQTAAWEKILTDGKVESAGKINDAGVVSVNGDNAQVLVASTATVKNSQAPNGEPRQYRMKVTLQRVSGQWLVSNLEFVP